MEFRNRSWHATITGGLPQQHNVCRVSTEYHFMPQRVYATTDFIYVRWLGRHGTYETKDRERVDKMPRLKEWLAGIRARQDEGIHTVYGFFNNDYSGHSPTTCQKFKELVGFPTRPLAPPQQKRLL